jgi:hypothetical protein
MNEIRELRDLDDYPARVRIVVDEDQGASQLGMFWGFRSRNYSSALTAALAYQAEALTPMDIATRGALSGASGGTAVTHASVATSWTPVLSTMIASGSAHMTHTGAYNVWARVYSAAAPTSTPPDVRLVWDVGDLTNPSENARWSIPAGSAFYDACLGQVWLSAPPVGTHRWQGVIQAMGATGAENVSIDRVWFQPLDENAGQLRAQMVSGGATLTGYAGRDEFNQAAGTLTGKTAQVGGTWAGSGDSDDFSVETTGKTAQRTATSDAGSGIAGVPPIGRFVRVGSALTSCAVQVDIKRNVAVPASGSMLQAVIARWVNSSNYAMAYVFPGSSPNFPNGTTLSWLVNVNNTISTNFVDIQDNPDNWYTLRLVVDAAGRIAVWHRPQGQVSGPPTISTAHSALATGGALASGTCGFYDANTGSTSVTRNYDNFQASAVDMDAVMFANQSVELSTHGMYREDSTGSAYGPVPIVTGALPRLPLSGLEGRPVEMFLKASRGDLDQVPDSGIDDISARVYYRPSWLFIPDA